MNSNRWDPFDINNLREAMNSLLEDSFVRTRSGAATPTSSVPLDVRETADHFVITAPLAGVRPDDVEIAVLGNSLRISGEVKDEQPEEAEQDGRWLMRERRFGRFERSIMLPTQVDSHRAVAEFDSGVLTITLPKAEEARPKTIPVKSAHPS